MRSYLGLHVGVQLRKLEAPCPALVSESPLIRWYFPFTSHLVQGPAGYSEKGSAFLGIDIRFYGSCAHLCFSTPETTVGFNTRYILSSSSSTISSTFSSPSSSISL